MKIKSEKRDRKKTIKGETLKTEIDVVQVKEESVKAEENEFNFTDIPKIKIEYEDSFNNDQVTFDYADDTDKEIGPKNWHEMYNLIVAIRNFTIAPVDTQGCERISSNMNTDKNSREYRFQILISLMLSSQTKDEVTHQAVADMDKYFKSIGFRGLCIEGILATTPSKIDELIAKVGFHSRKSVFITKTALLLVENFNSDIPKTIEEIVTLPGVGPKMGFLLLQNAWDINTGIGIDVHVHRLAQLWNWVPKTKNPTPEFSRKALESWLPKKYWKQINPLIVGFGQVVCIPKYPNCDICPVKRLCPGVNRKLANTPLSDERKKKLMTQRGDLSRLLKELS